MMKRQIFMAGIGIAAIAMISFGTMDGTARNLGNGKAEPVSSAEAASVKPPCDLGAVADPLILDLQGNGIFLGGQTKTTMLGGAIRMVRWTAANTDDAFVLVDATSIVRAGYGITDWSGAKITGLILLRDGVQVRTPDGRMVRVADSWQFIGALDANHDGGVSATDPSFAHLYAWIDKDANGAIGPGEITPLGNAGVRTIATQGSAFAQDQYGNRRSNGSYATSQGATRLAMSVVLSAVQ